MDTKFVSGHWLEAGSHQIGRLELQYTSPKSIQIVVGFDKIRIVDGASKKALYGLVWVTMSLRQLLEITHLLHARLVPQWTLRIGQNKIVRNNVGWVIHWLPLELILCIESVTVHSVCLSIYATESVPGALQGNDALIHQIVFWSVLMDTHHRCNFIFGALNNMTLISCQVRSTKQCGQSWNLGSWITIHQGGNSCHSQFIIWSVVILMKANWMLVITLWTTNCKTIWAILSHDFIFGGNRLIEDPGVLGS